MPRLTQVLSSALPQTGYEQANDLLGQIVDFISLSGHITVISDNNPLPGTRREIRFTIGDYPRVYRFYTESNSVVTFSIRNLIDTSDLAAYNISTSSLNNYNAWLLYSSHLFLASVVSTNHTILGVRMSDGTWYGAHPYNILTSWSSNTIIRRDVDNTIGLTLTPSYAFYGTGGVFHPVPAKMVVNSLILDAEPVPLYGLPKEGLQDHVTYIDASGHYWYVGEVNSTTVPYGSISRIAVTTYVR